MFCVKCGVELADSEKVCPLCGTVVYNPMIERIEQEPPYPVCRTGSAKINTKGIMLIITILISALLAQFVICELSIPAARNWAGYVIGGIMLLYIICMLPLWFRKPNPVIFIPCDHAAVLVYLLYINFMTGGKWFLSFALPTVGFLALILTAAAALLKYVRRGYFYIFGGTVLGFGAFFILLEVIINYTFKARQTLHWSFFPSAVCFIVGIMLIIIGVCKPLQEALRKKLVV